MALRTMRGSMNVVQAAEIRVKNIFSNGVKVYMSFSGGKDSLALAQVVLNLIRRGEIDPKQLVVIFIDEEAVYPDIDKTVRDWRKKFLMVGAQFVWFCLEVKHFNCFNSLENDESFICWDSTKQDVWVRQPPAFAIREHPLLNKRVDTYQVFLSKLCADGINMIGNRTAESLQRRRNVAMMFTSGSSMTGDLKAFPIYDWSNQDVWRYIKEQGVELPIVYLYLWQTGTEKNQLRVSQFFSVDTAKRLVKMNEYYPDLMEKVIRREPNAYLASLYWDSEMFGKNTRARRKSEGTQTDEGKDYRALILLKLKEIERSDCSKHRKYVAKQYRSLLIRFDTMADQVDYKKIYDGLVSGDPKLRTLRALFVQINTRHVNEMKKVLYG